ncbi:dihydrolipoyl dehydrogenase [Candidatus Thiothrix sp. Deng01]|uniref:Dihydrolipoyl dehydrogenase n=1 Tax=Candidatus Thiothrix phosphatis TaxID=3112415 RepID=A0ABU6D1I9_9GAMM|nr:dihydrolipoyl dehydrogenase [Candidatus Thiothrix sp. Deng01]MEB4592716.1 dihydrolipoyl dehydrogenase [Candidatus Thiothrix sp. Deng01]
MSNIVEVKVPDIGSFDNVEIIEVLVEPGFKIEPEESLITIESDKATMEIPSPLSGTVKEVKVKVGDKVSEGSLILLLEVSEAKASEETPPSLPLSGEGQVAAPAPQAATFSGSADLETEVVVLGSGPGGYTAAFRAADLGKKVVLIERYSNIGGVCLNVGCIPSKALLHTAEVINEAKEFAQYGVKFGEPEIDIDAIRAHKDGVVGKLTGGLKALAKQRKVTVVQGYGRFTSANTIEVEAGDGGKQTVKFAHCIIAAGSRVTKLPFIPWGDPRVMDSTDALALQEVPQRLLVVGGGIIGLEMATVYHALGSNITVVELSPGLMPGADRDIVKPLHNQIKKQYENIYLNTKVTAIEPTAEGLMCSFEGKDAPEKDTFDRVLVAVGRSPNGGLIDAGKAGVFVDARGFIPVDRQMRTNVPHIFAIGDIVGQPMLAHKATHEGKVAAEVIAGRKSYFDAKAIPSVAYTSPEVAWMGKTEEQCKAEGVAYEKGVFPWAASGRALSMDASNGLTKALFDKENGQLIGVGIAGRNAGELIAEAVLALEMGADAHDIGLTIHPHPTLSETLNFAAEVAEGTCTDIYAPKK